MEKQIEQLASELSQFLPSGIKNYSLAKFVLRRELEARIDEMNIQYSINPSDSEKEAQARYDMLKAQLEQLDQPIK